MQDAHCKLGDATHEGEDDGEGIDPVQGVIFERGKLGSH